MLPFSGKLLRLSLRVKLSLLKLTTQIPIGTKMCGMRRNAPIAVRNAVMTTATNVADPLIVRALAMAKALVMVKVDI